MDRSDSMPWYKGPLLLYHLENVYVGSDFNHIDARFQFNGDRPHSDGITTSEASVEECLVGYLKRATKL